MSFLNENFSPVGGQARSGDSPATWSYRSTDNLAAILGAGYFNEIAAMLRASDYIFTKLSDTRAILTVTSVILAPNENEVVINPIPYTPGKSINDIIKFGCLSMSRTPGDQYLLPGPQNRIAQGSDIIRMPFQGPGTLSSIRVKHSVPDGDAEPIVYTAVIDGTPTSLSVSLDADKSFAVNIGNVDIESLNPEISIKASKEFDIRKTPKDIIVSVVFS